MEDQPVYIDSLDDCQATFAMLIDRVEKLEAALAKLRAAREKREEPHDL